MRHNYHALTDSKQTDFLPAYLQLEPGSIARRAEEAVRRLEDCRMCPRDCGVNRLAEETGVCRTGRKARVASYNPHFGEERPLVGTGGSGTIFFAWCNLRCAFCQNYDISQLGKGGDVEADQLAAMMLELQSLGCHNINFVTPTHVVPQILEALALAAEGGLRLPLVYNTGGYDGPDTLELLDGIVDIYMPDLKYSDEMTARKLSGVLRYPERNRRAVKEMHRQVGDLIVDERGVALRGLIVRHLVLPEDKAGTEDIARFIAEEISPRTYFNLMDQYYPCYRAFERPPLDRRLTVEEFSRALEAIRKAGLLRLAE